MSSLKKKGEPLYDVSIRLDGSKDAAVQNGYYLPGHTISGSVSFAFRNKSKEGANLNQTSDASIRSIHLVATGKEELERGKLNADMLVDHVYFKRVITLAGMQDREERTRKADLRKRLATYIRKNGSHNPLSGVVLNTHKAALSAAASAAAAAAADEAANAGHTEIEITDARQSNFYAAAAANVPATSDKSRGGKGSGRAGASGRDARLVEGGELRDDEILLVEEDSVDYPLAFPHSNGAKTSSSSSSRPPAHQLELDRRQTYTFPFAFLLPPWVPPSFHFDRDYVGAMRYSVDVYVVLNTPPAATAKEGKAAAPSRPTCVASKCVYVCAAVPKRELLQAHERSNLKPLFSLTQRLRTFPSNALVRFFSKAPKGLLDVRVQFVSSTNLVLRDTADQRVGLLFGCAPSSSVAGGSAAAPDGSGAAHADPAAGVTVTGAVVSAASAGLTSVASVSSVEPTAPVRTLRLRVTVANGGFRGGQRVGGAAGAKGDAITKVKVELLECIKVRAYSSASAAAEDGEERGGGDAADAEPYQSMYDYNCPPIRLSKCVLRGNVPYGEQSTFDAELTLPPRFHHGEAHIKKAVDGQDGGKGKPFRGGDDDKAFYSIPPPPTNIHTQRVHITTELRVSFPEVRTIAEEAAPRNVVVLSEYMDPTDILPFLPNEYQRSA